MNNTFFDRIIQIQDETNNPFIPANDINRLLTVEVLYYLPDYPSIIQSFVLQLNDISPNYPNLDRFLTHWEKEIIAKINSVRVSVGTELHNYKFKCIKDLINLF